MPQEKTTVSVLQTENRHSFFCLQQIEDSVLKSDEKGLRISGEDEGAPPTSVPARVASIVTKHLSVEDLALPQPGSMTAPTVDSLSVSLSFEFEMKVYSAHVNIVTKHLAVEYVLSRRSNLTTSIVESLRVN